MIGDLDEAKGGGRPYKSEMWKERLKTPEEKEEEKKRENEFHKQAFENAKQRRLTPRELAILQRGGSI
jgi:hypothetical protein